MEICMKSNIRSIFANVLAVSLAAFHAQSAFAQPAVFSGAGLTGGPRVQGNLSLGTGTTLFDQFVYEDTFRGGASIAFGDINKDGVSDLLTCPGPTGGPRLRVISGKNVQLNISTSFADGFVHDSADRSGITCAAGDVDGDGYADAIIGINANGRVKIFNGALLASNQFVTIFDQQIIQGWTGQVNVAGGDINKDGYADFAVSPGDGGGPVLSVLNGATARFNSNIETTSGAKFMHQFAYESVFRGGVRVAIADVTGDTFPDVITGAGDTGAPRVRVFGATQVLNNQATSLFDQFVFDSALRNGVHVGGFDLNSDGKAELVVSNSGVVKVLSGSSAAINSITELSSYSPFGAFSGGINVTGAFLPLAVASTVTPTPTGTPTSTS